MIEMQLWRRRLLFFMLFGAVVFAHAQVGFSIAGYRIVGNTLLTAKQLDAATEPFVGASSDFETIQKALESLERSYIAEGYGSVRVELPEQELDSGVVTLQVVEGVLGDIAIQSSGFYDNENVRHSLPALRPGLPVNIHALNRNLVLANEAGSKVTSVTFKRSLNSKDVDAAVKLQADDPERWLLVLDNTGSDLNGHYRVGLVYQNANFWNRDHAVLGQIMSSPGSWGQVHIIGLGYRVPLYALGDTFEVNASDSNVDSRGTVSGADIAAVGKGRIVGMRYTRNLDPSAEWQHKLSAGLESRNYNNVGNTGESNLSTLPLTLGYSGNWRSAQRDWSLSATWQKNIPAGPSGWDSDLNAEGGRAGSRADFQTWKFSAQLSERFLNQWTLRAALSGQLTQDLLIAAEQFGAGGTESVRGFAEREAAGDQGLRVGLEMGFAPWEVDQLRLTPLVFMEAASVRRNSPLPGEIESQTLSSVGVGLRASYGRQASARVDWGFVTRGVDGTPGAVSNGAGRGDRRLHMSFVWIN